MGYLSGIYLLKMAITKSNKVHLWDEVGPGAYMTFKLESHLKSVILEHFISDPSNSDFKNKCI